MNYYCVRCKSNTDTKNIQKVKTSKGQPMIKGNCIKCGNVKTRFISKSQKKGGIIFSLPALVAGATALGSLASGASAVAKTINEKKAAQKKLEETRRHNLQMEKKGERSFFKPIQPSSKKSGRGSFLKTFQKMNIPIKPLSQYDIMIYVKKLKLKNFRGIYMRDALPKYSNNENECGILNLDSSEGSGTHWTCWLKKCNNLCYYFDSFGVDAPKEFENYIQSDIIYSTYQIQKLNEVICGHLCLMVLYGLGSLKIDFHSVLSELFFLYNK